jgi:hypothetical protein
MQGELFTLRCKDNSFKYNKICFTGQSAFLLHKNPKKIIFQAILYHFLKKNGRKSVVNTNFHYFCSIV